METILAYIFVTRQSGQNCRATRSRRSSNEQSDATERLSRAICQLRISRRRPLNGSDYEALGLQVTVANIFGFVLA